MKDFSNTLFPCSQISHIIKAGKTFHTTKVKKLNELMAKPILNGSEAEKLEALLLEMEECDSELSKGAKGFLVKRYVVEKYYRDSEATPLQMVKGARVEINSLGFFCDVTGSSHRKNKKSYTSDFLIGTPDVVEDDYVIEIKSSWDIYTFLNNLKSEVNYHYYWQLQGYLSLTGKEKAELIYCLISTPDDIIEDEYNRLTIKNPSIIKNNKLNKQLRDTLFFNMRFDDIPKDERVLRFSVERNEGDIDRINKKVSQAREYLEEFQKQHIYFTKQHRKSILSSLKTEVYDGNSED